LELLGIPLPPEIQGRSFVKMLKNEDYPERDAVFAEKTFHTAYEPQRAIRTRRYKLIWNIEVDIMNVPGDIMHSPIYPQMIDEITKERPNFELYDLVNDPHERNNLADDPDHEEVFNDLRMRLLAWMRETDDPILAGPVASPYYHYGLLKLEDDQ
jgi:arylsulfatase A-like enzyme